VFTINRIKWKSGKQQGKPGLIHHVSGTKGARLFKYVHTSLTASLPTVKMNSFNHANISSPELQ